MSAVAHRAPSDHWTPEAALSLFHGSECVLDGALALGGDDSSVAWFVIERRTGPHWDPERPLEEQSGWIEHAEFMDGLVDDGFVVLGGPLADELRVILVVDATSEDEVRTRLARDPWSGSHLVVESVDAWTIRLDGRNH